MMGVNAMVCEVQMTAKLVVISIDGDIARALTKRAALNGRTEEEERFEILRNVLLQPARKSLAEVLVSMPNVGREAISTYVPR
ncbi:hypothetical protein [Pseudoduganella sp. HUAS MS19]